MAYEAEIVTDSISPEGVRLTTFQVTYPHAVHKDIMTHRMLSRNFLSFRAFPPEKVIAQIETDPFIPEVFGRRVKGMGQRNESILEGETIDQAWARELWMAQISDAIRRAKSYLDMDIAKQQVNFLLQDFTWITGLITATEWSNFFALRADPDPEGPGAPRPEVQKIAIMMRDLYNDLDPWTVQPDEWHLPLEHGFPYDGPVDWDWWKSVCTGRCARISYLMHDGLRDQDKDVALHDGLLTNHHMSPPEHIARPWTPDEWETCRELQAEVAKTLQLPKARRDQWCRELEFDGNFRGWHQYRKDIPNEHDASRVL